MEKLIKDQNVEMLEMFEGLKVLQRGGLKRNPR